MRSAKKTLSVFVVFFLLQGATPASQEAERAFNSLYGERMEKAQATPSFEDDVILAAEFLECARSSAEKPALLKVFCEKAYQLGSKNPAGHLTAVKGMEMLIQEEPEKREEYLQKCVNLFQEEYRRVRGSEKTKAGQMLVYSLIKLSKSQNLGEALTTIKHALNVSRLIGSYKKDTLQTLLDSLLERQEVQEKVDFLKKKLAENPGSSKIRENLVLLYLIEFDNPEKASEFLNDSLDSQLKKYVPAAAKSVEEAPKLASLEMGKWYNGLANQAKTTQGKAAVLWRSKDYYERFLELHEEDDFLRTNANLALKRISQSLKRLDVSPPEDKPGLWVDCMELVSLPECALEGKWIKAGKKLAVAKKEGSCLLALPLSPQKNYQLQVSFKRVEGKGQVGVILPVDQRKACGVVLDGFYGWGHGIERVYPEGSEKGFRCGEWVHTGKLINNKDYLLDVKAEWEGEQVEITVSLNGSKINRWQGKISSLRSPDWRQPSSDFITLHAWGAQAIFTEIRFRTLAGSSKEKLLSAIMKEVQY